MSQFDPAWAVLTAVATKEGTTPEALLPPLADVIEPDTLDRLLRESSAESNAAVRFNYRGHEVSKRTIYRAINRHDIDHETPPKNGPARRLWNSYPDTVPGDD